MKKTLYLIAFVLLLSAAEAQKVTVDNWKQLQVEFTTGNLQVSQTQLGGTAYNTIFIDGYLPSSEVGQPCLPTWSSLIEVPFCEGYMVSVRDAIYDTLDATALGLRHPLLPLQPSRSKSDTLRHAPVIGKAYGTDAFYGVALASVEAVGIARDRQLVRLQFSPVRYNPVSGMLIVCRQATVEVRYRDADQAATLQHFERYHTPAFGSGIDVLNNLYPKSISSSAPIRYLIVAHSMFRGHLDSFVQWKRQKGFQVDVAYTDSAAVGTTTTSIQNFIHSQYTGATADNPAPTYLLLVGDHEQVPAFDGTTDDDHITDLYYTTWTSGDNIPDCYHGRFSAQSVAQLTPQVQKTLMYEQYTFNDPSFLDRAVMVAGVDGGADGDYGYTHADPAMDYAIINYINGANGYSQVRYFKNNTSIIPAGATNVTVQGNSYSMSGTIRGYYNQGAGWINYSAHGGSDCWGNPELTVSQVNSMTNNYKFGVMVGNCCLTNKFETTTCLGEALLRKGNYAGAVGYIGGSNSTYWGEDFYWAVGVRGSIGPTMSMAYNASNRGAYDRVMHTHGEAYSQWAVTQGALMFQGNMAVQGSTSSLKHYYWEIYHLMGDPSVMPYMTQADIMTLTATNAVTVGTPSLPVTAVPYAYVALVDTVNQQLISSAFADASGSASLVLPPTLAIGSYLLTASAQQYRTAFADLLVIQPEGPYPLATASVEAPLNAGDTVALTLHFENLGNATAHHIVAHLASNNPMLVLTADSVVLDSLVAGATADITLPGGLYVVPDAADLALANLSVSSSWTGATLTSASLTSLYLYAPVLTIAFTQPNPTMQPGSDATLTATLRNSGHASTGATPLTVTPATALLSVASSANAPFALAPDGEHSVSLLLHADSLLPQFITVPVEYRYGTLAGTLPVYLGPGYAETFEGGSMQLPGVTNNGSHSWIVVDTVAYEGIHSMRSAANLSNYDSSVMRIAVNVTGSDSVSFYYRVSSEEDYDKFYFLIDGVEKFNASGEVDWTRAAYPLAAGNHQLTFRYAKDVSWDRGNDCAWIDNLVLPHQVQNVVFRRDTLCADAAYAPFGTPVDTHEPHSGSLVGTTDGTTTVIDYLVLASTSYTDSVVACDSYLFGGTEYTADGIYTQIYTAPHGCTDTVTLVLTLHHSVAVTVTDTAEGDSYTWNGVEYTASGEYQQVLTTAEGCDSTVTLMLTLLGSEGIEEFGVRSSELRVFPNPASDVVTVTVGTQRAASAVDITIFDLQGRSVFTQAIKQSGAHAITLDVSDLPQGVYLLRISTAQEVSATRLVIGR